jgi:2-methylcitrate dehydratase PrpD
VYKPASTKHDGTSPGSRRERSVGRVSVAALRLVRLARKGERGGRKCYKSEENGSLRRGNRARGER